MAASGQSSFQTFSIHPSAHPHPSHQQRAAAQSHPMLNSDSFPSFAQSQQHAALPGNMTAAASGAAAGSSFNHAFVPASIGGASSTAASMSANFYSQFPMYAHLGGPAAAVSGAAGSSTPAAADVSNISSPSMEQGESNRTTKNHKAAKGGKSGRSSSTSGKSGNASAGASPSFDHVNSGVSGGSARPSVDVSEQGQPDQHLFAAFPPNAGAHLSADFASSSFAPFHHPAFPSAIASSSTAGGDSLDSASDMSLALQQQHHHQMQLQHHLQLQQHLYYQQQQQQHQQQHYHLEHEDSSGEFEESIADMDEEDADVLLDMCEDPVMRERLRLVQQVQEAASMEGASGIFACPYCDKEYFGKHARSIWRRHLQDKHSIPLSQQPRRTRWDGDANRPKNAAERRQRMLESKRRWARKRRLMDKVAAGGADPSALEDAQASTADQSEASLGNVSSSAPQPTAAEPSPEERRASKGAATTATKKRSSTGGSGNAAKPRGMQQIKFHHITTTNVSQFVNANTAYNKGAITWNSAHQKSSTFVPSTRPFSKHASMPQVPSTQAGKPPMLSPRRPLMEIDMNANAGRKNTHAMPAMDAQDALAMKKIKLEDNPYQQAYQNGQPVVMPMHGNHEVPGAKTPMNRYSALYPTPPSANDDKSLAAQVFGGGALSAKSTRSSSSRKSRPLSPPASQHTVGSSPFNKRHNPSAMLSPVSSGRRKPHQSPNPFSLDQHKISPAATTKVRLATGLDTPLSASRLSGALQDKDENRLSPLQVGRALANDGDMDDILAEPHNASKESPVSKTQKLPSLAKTPLRPHGKLLEGASVSLLASSSVRKAKLAAGLAPNGLAAASGNTQSTTPTRQQLGHLFGAGSSLGLTPFDARNGSAAGGKYSVTRSGFYTRPSPIKGGDQFSSPQHLNLTQSLGLAPHSTSKGSGSMLSGLASLTGTPFINSILNNSPWPDSVRRPSFRTSSSKRGASITDEDEDADDLPGNKDDDRAIGGKLGRGGSSDDEGDDDDDDNQVGGIHETPSRPAKRPQSSLLGTQSPTNSQRLRSSATRSQQSSLHKGDASSATRSRRSNQSAGHGRRMSDLPALTFQLSSPTSAERGARKSTGVKEGESTDKTTTISKASFEKELLEPSGKEARSSSPTVSQSSERSLGLDIRDEDSIDDLI